MDDDDDESIDEEDEDESIDEEDEDTTTGVDETVGDGDELLPPPPPPQAEVEIIAIKIKSALHIFIVYIIPILFFNNVERDEPRELNMQCIPTRMKSVCCFIFRVIKHFALAWH